MREYIYSFNSVGLPSVIGIVEAWLHKDISNDCFNLPEYNIKRFDRPTKGGGVMLLSNVKYQIAKSECLFFGPIQVLFCDILSLLAVFEMCRLYVFIALRTVNNFILSHFLMRLNLLSLL